MPLVCRRPVPIEGAIETIDVDEDVVGVGVSPNPLIPRAFGGLEVSKKGTIVVEEDSMRSALGDVYAGGDIVRGGATVILAMGDGRRPPPLWCGLKRISIISISSIRKDGLFGRSVFFLLS